MSYVNKDEMTELRTAAESLETASTSEDTVQLKSVAYAINTAANSGATRCIFQEPLRSNTKKELASKGYHITYVKAANPEGQALISWSERSTLDTDDSSGIDDSSDANVDDNL